MATYNYTVGSAPAHPPYSNDTILNNHWTEDVYNFSTSQTSSINLNLHNISAGDDADLQLYRDVNGNGLLETAIDQLIGSSAYGGNRDDFINRLEPAGNYLARVYEYDLGSNNHLDYELDLSATPDTPSPADDPAQAPNLLPREVILPRFSIPILQQPLLKMAG